MLFSSTCIAFPFETLNYVSHQGLAQMPCLPRSLPADLLPEMGPSILSSRMTWHFHRAMVPSCLWASYWSTDFLALLCGEHFESGTHADTVRAAQNDTMCFYKIK